MIKFTNDHLASIGFPVENLETDFSDGTRLILLLGALEGYFIPLYSFKLQPVTAQEKLENVQFAFKIMTESGQEGNGTCKRFCKNFYGKQHPNKKVLMLLLCSVTYFCQVFLSQETVLMILSTGISKALSESFTVYSSITRSKTQ